MPKSIQAFLHDQGTVEVALPSGDEVRRKAVGADEVEPVVEVEEHLAVLAILGLDLDVLLVHGLVALDEDGGHRVEGWMLGFQPIEKPPPEMEKVNELLAQYVKWEDRIDSAIIISAADNNYVY